MATNLSGTLSPPRPRGGAPSERRASGGRARDLLRQHYGLGAGVPAPSGKPNDPLDMDSPAFDAAGYYTQMLATSTLPTLLKQQNVISEEIRQLDGERQSLVYNHHHELIGASDTIRAMKSRAEGLDSDMEKLKSAFSEISRIGAKLAVEITSSNVTKPLPQPPAINSDVALTPQDSRRDVQNQPETSP